MSGFPGQHSYGEFASRQRERDLEAGRHDVRPAERSAELHDITDAIRLRIDILKLTKVDRMTTPDLDKIVRILEGCLEYIKSLQELTETQEKCISAYRERDRDRLKG